MTKETEEQFRKYLSDPGYFYTVFGANQTIKQMIKETLEEIDRLREKVKLLENKITTTVNYYCGDK